MQRLRTLFICISILCSVLSPAYATTLIVPLSAGTGFSLDSSQPPKSWLPGYYAMSYSNNGTVDTAWPNNGDCAPGGGRSCASSDYAFLHVPKNATRGELDLGVKKKAKYPLELYKNGVQQFPPVGVEWFLQLGYEGSSLYNMRTYGIVVPNSVNNNAFSLKGSRDSCSVYWGGYTVDSWVTGEKEERDGYKVYKSLPYQTKRVPCTYNMDFSDMDLSEKKDIRIRSLATSLYVSTSVFQNLPAGIFQGKVKVDDYATVRYYDANNQLLSTENLFDELEVNLRLLLGSYFKFDIVGGESIHLTFVDGKDDVVRGVSIFNIQTNMSKTYYSITCPMKTTDGRCGLKDSNGSVLPLNLKYLQRPSDSYLSAQPLMPDKVYSNVDDLKGAAVLRNITFGLLLELNKKDISSMSDKDGIFEGTVILTVESSID